jgi:hypothetical protein
VQEQGEYRQADEDFRPMLFNVLDECLHTIEYSTLGTLMQFHGAGSAKTPRLFSFLISQLQIIVGIGIVWIDFNGFIEIFNCLFVLF